MNANRKVKSAKNQLPLLFPTDSSTEFVALQGNGSLSAFSMKFAVIEVGTATPYIPKLRSRFKNFGIIMVKDVPNEDFGNGPHFILVEIPDQIEEPKLEGRSYGKCLHTPTAILGSSRPNCTPPHWLNKGEWIDAIMPKRTSILKGKLIGRAAITNGNQTYSIHFENQGNPIFLASPTLFFESPFTIEMQGGVEEEFVCPLTEEFMQDKILFVRSIPNKDRRIIYPARINANALVIPSVTLNELYNVCEVIREDKEEVVES